MSRERLGRWVLWGLEIVTATAVVALLVAYVIDERAATERAEARADRIIDQVILEMRDPSPGTPRANTHEAAREAVEGMREMGAQLDRIEAKLDDLLAEERAHRRVERATSRCPDGC